MTSSGLEAVAYVQERIGSARWDRFLPGRGSSSASRPRVAEAYLRFPREAWAEVRRTVALTPAPAITVEGREPRSEYLVCIAASPQSPLR